MKWQPTGGSGWAVLHPRTSLITPFDDRFASELVWAIAGDDAALRRYINALLAREQARGKLETLFNHWVRLGSSSGRPAGGRASLQRLEHRVGSDRVYISRLPTLAFRGGSKLPDRDYAERTLERR